MVRRTSGESKRCDFNREKEQTQAGTHHRLVPSICIAVKFLNAAKQKVIFGHKAASSTHPKT